MMIVFHEKRITSGGEEEGATKIGNLPKETVKLPFRLSGGHLSATIQLNR